MKSGVHYRKSEDGRKKVAINKRKRRSTKAEINMRKWRWT
jgi:hypothetical protein